MKLIAYGGLPSKNSPISSREAYLLAIKSRFITGIAVDLYYTTHNQIVALTKQNLQRLSLTEQQLLNKTPEEIKRTNIGNMIKIHNLLSLNDILDIYTNQKTNDVLVLDLKDSIENAKFVDEVLSLIKIYPWVNIYIKSSSNEINEYLLASRNVADFKLGRIIDKYNKVDLTSNVDFFSVKGNILSKEDVEELLNRHEIMYEDVDFIVDFSNLVKTLGEPLASRVSVITDIVAMVYKNYGVTL